MPESATRHPIPRYFLYGEVPRQAVPGFVHVETLQSRSALHGWEIAAHRHDGLQQVLWISRGGGTARLDQRRQDFAGPALLIVPAGCVHDFRWSEGSEGHVLTMATDFIAGLAPILEPQLARTLDAARVVPLTVAEAVGHGLPALFERLERELRFHPPGMAAAVASCVVLLMAAVLRLAPADPEPMEAGAELWQRYRAAVEQEFRRAHGVAEISAGLAVTRGRLDAACRRHAGRTAQQVIHDRLALEAQRGLIYTGMTVAEIAYDLGFADPAYFTRFFAREVGEPPGEFRRRNRSAER